MKGIYQYTDLKTDNYVNGKHKRISSVNIKKLEEKVKAKGLEWLKFEKGE